MNIEALTEVGVVEPWQVAMCCPTMLEDYRVVNTNFADVYQQNGQKVVISGTLSSLPQFEWVRGKGVLTIKLLDNNNYLLTIKIFGDTRKLQDKINTVGDSYFFQGISFANGQYLNLRAAKDIDSYYAYRLCPIYKGKRGKISNEQVRKEVHRLLPNTIAMTEKKLRRVFEGQNNIRKILKAKNLNLRDALRELHYPTSIDAWNEAKTIIKRIAALSCIRGINKSKSLETVKTTPFINFSIPELMKTIPFPLTDEQNAIVEDISHCFKAGNRIKGALIGDVGTGKTVVYGMCAAALVSAGGRVAIMLPSQTLATQIHEELSSYWPQLNAKLITNETEASNLEGVKLLIGTSALLHRNVGQLDMVIVDEQQRFGLEQREQLVNDKAHYIEVTATPIPRTQALLKYSNDTKVFRLTKTHCEKVIITKLRLKTESNLLMQECLNEIEAGNKILVVCPTKDNSDNFASVEDVYIKWNKFARNKVRYVHSGKGIEHNNKAMSDVKSGKAQVLIATTMIEIGVTIPKLTKTVVYHAERFGTITCHQIRGRLVRHGGHGQLDLYCPTEISDQSLQRLLLLTKFDDGFELATQDMYLRGFGDLSKSHKLSQSGETKSILIGETINIDDIEDILSLLN